LTSAGIQKRYLAAVERRSRVDVYVEYILINVNGNEKYDNINPINVDASTQSKVKESKVTSMSGKPDVKPIFDYLNQRTGRRYRPTSANSAHAVARMKDGHTLADFKAVIDGRLKAWGGDPKMAEYLRPETLFGTKFDSYLATAFAPTTVSSATEGWECPTCHKTNTHTGGMCVYCKGARES